MSIHLLRLVYVSRATAMLTGAVLGNILTAARARNDELGVSGVLCAGQGYFVQVLEGQQNDVLGLYASIVKDGRHTEVNLLSISLVAARAFPNWSMAHIDGDALSPSVMQKLISEAVVERVGNSSLKMLKSAVAALRGGA
jgi:Sensors of blue-light using FAD